MMSLHTILDFFPCRDATEEMQICQVCGEDRRDHLGYEAEPGEAIPGVIEEGVEVFTFSPDPVRPGAVYRGSYR